MVSVTVYQFSPVEMLDKGLQCCLVDMRQFVQELLVLGDFSTFILNGWGREKKMRRKVKLLNKSMNTEDIYSTNGQDQRKSWEGKMERKKKKKKAQDESTKDQNREKG